MARNRASMREGPLAELFRATEAAQRGETQAAGEQQQLQTEPEQEQEPEPSATQPPVTRAEERAPEPPTPIRAVAPAPGPEDSVPDGQSPTRMRPAAHTGSSRCPTSRARLERARDSASYLAVIRVVGVGGAGLNAVDRMIDAGITQVDFLAVNTDIQQLQMSDAPTKIHIGSELTEGLGSGADPRGRPARGRGRLRRRSSARCAAPTWSSSRQARAAAPARARRRSSRGSRASSAR